MLIPILINVKMAGLNTSYSQWWDISVFILHYLFSKLGLNFLKNLAPQERYQNQDHKKRKTIKIPYWNHWIITMKSASHKMQELTGKQLVLGLCLRSWPKYCPYIFCFCFSTLVILLADYWFLSSAEMYLVHLCLGDGFLPVCAHRFSLGGFIWTAHY